MSEKQLRILLTELTTVRLKCSHCKNTGETTIDRARSLILEDAKCPFCQKKLFPATTSNTLIHFLEAVNSATLAKDSATIEFVIPDKS